MMMPMIRWYDHDDDSAGDTASDDGDDNCDGNGPHLAKVMFRCN